MYIVVNDGEIITDNFLTTPKIINSEQYRAFSLSEKTIDNKINYFLIGHTEKGDEEIFHSHDKEMIKYIFSSISNYLKENKPVFNVTDEYLKFLFKEKNIDRRKENDL